MDVEEATRQNVHCQAFFDFLRPMDVLLLGGLFVCHHVLILYLFKVEVLSHVSEKALRDLFSSVMKTIV